MKDLITYYHLYNRGCNREKIFFKEKHYLFFLSKIKSTYQEKHIRIAAYCLMPNHYHLLVGCDEYRKIADWMKNILNGFVQAINKDMNRNGTLFESRMKHIAIKEEGYLIHLVRYIHLNPAITGLCAQPEQWQYSNCQEWLGLRSGTLFDRDFFNTYFETHLQYKEFLEAYQDYKEQQKSIRKYLFDE